MNKLNRASLDVWGDYLKDESRKKISDRILELDSFFELTQEQENELEVLLNIEKKYIIESEINIDDSKKVVRRFNFYKNKLSNDDRLSSIFYERVNEMMKNDDSYNEEDIKKIYFKMMEEDMDVHGHDNLVKYYNEVLINKKDSSTVSCDNPECLYCSMITDEEYFESFDRLTVQGYFDANTDNENNLIELMVLINRLENRLSDLDALDHDLLDDEDEDED